MEIRIGIENTYVSLVLLRTKFALMRSLLPTQHIRNAVRNWNENQNS